MFLDMPFMARGGIVALFGLLGTFIVIVLIYAAVKHIGRVGVDKGE